MTESELLSWKAFDIACRRIANKVMENKWKIDYIYGIPRGGLVVAVRLSHILGKPLIGSINFEHDNIDFKALLVVDDIADTGKTLDYWRNHTDVKIATVYYHRQSSVIPDIWVYEKQRNWITFPWERP